MKKDKTIWVLVSIVVLIMVVFTIFKIELSGSYKIIGYVLSGGIFTFIVYKGFVKK